MDREALIAAIPSRHSVRRYVSRPIEADKQAVLRAEITRLNAQERLGLQLVTDDKRAFGSWFTHYGAFHGVDNYIALVGEPSADLDPRLGYAGEHLVLAAQALGLNTCWVGLTFGKGSVRRLLQGTGRLRGVIALGYGETQGHGHRIKRFEAVSDVTADRTPDWYRRGVEAALLAPTAINQQKFRFSLRPDGSVGLRAGFGYLSRMDAGIVRYHFELASGHEVQIEN